MTPRLISVQERRARIGTRHRLVASARAASPEEGVKSLVALHPPDAATGVLSAPARPGPPSLGGGGRVVVVAGGVGGGVQGWTTRDVWVKERASLLKSAADAGLAKTWLDELEARTVEALGERGLATGSELSKAVPGLRDQVLYG